MIIISIKISILPEYYYVMSSEKFCRKICMNQYRIFFPGHQGRSVHKTAHNSKNFVNFRLSKGSRKKVIFLVAWPLRGGGGVRALPLRKNNFF